MNDFCWHVQKISIYSSGDTVIIVYFVELIFFGGFFACVFYFLLSTFSAKTLF